MIKSLVDISCRSLANLNKSVLDLIRRSIIKLCLYDKKTNSYKIIFNNVKFEINDTNDLIITGFRFLEVDGELYLFDLKDQSAISTIKTQYFTHQLNNTTIENSDFIESFANPLK